MEQPAGFMVEGKRGVYRPVGSANFEDMLALGLAALTFARSIDLNELLINLTALTGLPILNTIQRYTVATAWATEARGRIRATVVVPPEMIDPEKFAVLVATNLGVVCDVFTTEAEAFAWLDKVAPGST